MPETWKISLVILVRKPNKNSFDPANYRTIALTSCICKLMEKIMYTRLVWNLESNNLLSQLQFGFKKNSSTLDPLLRLTNHIQEGFANQCQTVAVFFDMQKAYDTTWRFGIIKELDRMGLKGNMINFINSFFSDRFVKVRVGNAISSPYQQEEGIPQGSVLSVACFAVAINNIFKAVAPPVKDSLFVDDFTIYCAGYDAISTCRYVQKSLDAVSKWADEHGFTFSPTKTVAVRFTRRRKAEIVPTLKLKDNILPFESKVKCLGMILDEKLTWGAHTDDLQMKIKNSG